MLEREREGEDEILAADYHLPPAESDEEREREGGRAGCKVAASLQPHHDGRPGRGEARGRGSNLGFVLIFHKGLGEPLCGELQRDIIIMNL